MPNPKHNHPITGAECNGGTIIRHLDHRYLTDVLELRKNFPDAKIMLLAIFPRGAGPSDPNRRKNEEANKIIAKQLDISVRTIESRRHEVFAKMKVESVAELVRSGESLVQGLRKTWELSAFTVRMLGRIVTGDAANDNRASISSSPVSPSTVLRISTTCQGWQRSATSAASRPVVTDSPRTFTLAGEAFLSADRLDLERLDSARAADGVGGITGKR